MFREMRSKANMLTNEEVENILKTSPNGTLALYGENGYPYSVPVNFVYSDGKIYFHGAAEGYKLDCMKKDPHVSFSVIGKDDIAKENFTTLFSSVIAFGTIRVMILWKKRSLCSRPWSASIRLSSWKAAKS